MTLTTIVLTKNEEIHLQRCIDSVKGISDKIYVVDSYSTDGTKGIALENQCIFLQRPWSSHAEQFNWALEQLPKDTKWILRIDADEYLDSTLAANISLSIEKSTSSNVGYYVKRSVVFQGGQVRFGGVKSLNVLRLFLYGKGMSEKRIMDEHIVVHGNVGSLEGNLIDHNLNPLSWWIVKHNNYAKLEAYETLKKKYPHEFESPISSSYHSSLKRTLKNKLYLKLPTGLRAIMYFVFRFFILGGMFDTKGPRSYHFLQGLWYRYLVDLKVNEVERHRVKNKTSIRESLYLVLGIRFID